MYTELNEVVQFIAYRMHNRVPYHKICLFAEHLANLMLLRYHAGWDIADPSKNSDNRVLLIVTRANYQQSANDLILSATNSVGLDLEEVLFCLPETLEFRIDPGRVMVREPALSCYVTIWVGPFDADQDYRAGPLVSLSLRPPEELGVDNPTDNSKFLMFRYVVPGTPNFTAEEFAQTRFGSLRKRPDPDQVSRIRHQLKKFTLS